MAYPDGRVRPAHGVYRGRQRRGGHIFRVDDLSTATVNLVNGLLKSPDCFSYGLNTEAGNNLFLCKSNGLHQTLTGRHFLYNAWIDILFH